ncbi:ABC transporter ATP-binding protein/permease [Streptomyces sp. WAC00276]|uniref:ABC transporter ATP-binding protein n=1 Tax=Streptomyces sp. WAC00276 TaxID=2933778 RepID=UPI0020003582|nr:ABC transporter ATP-binding protein/permease [Streptomyces sp. WAC00276]
MSASEEELFGGPLRYDTGWSRHEYAFEGQTLAATLRAFPSMVAGTLRLAARADRRALWTVGAAEVGQGAAAAVGLVLVNQVLGALLGTGEVADRLHGALPALVAGGAVAVVGALLASLSTAATGRLEPKVERTANERYLSAVVAVELEAVEDGEFRRLIDVADLGASSARRMVGQGVSTVNSLLSLLAAAGVLTVLHPVLLPMLVLIAAPRGWGAMRVTQRRYASVMLWVEHRRASSLIGRHLTSRESAPEIRVHGAGAFLLRHFRAMAANAEAEQARLARERAGTELAAAALSGLAMLVTWVALGLLVVSGRVDLAVAGTAVVAIRTGSATLGALVVNLNNLTEESLYVADLENCVARAAERAIPVGGAALPGKVAEVRFEEVRFGYPDRAEPVLDGVSLRVRTGEVTAVVGENGAGKSTLMKLLSGLLLPASGRVLWDGVDLREADRAQVFAQVGLVTQDFERWPMTAGTNIRIGAPDRPGDPATVHEAARAAGAGPLVDGLPRGLDTLLSRVFKGGSDLSGGQWQRIGLARAEYRDARFLLVDEPTSALDPEAEIAAFDRIRGLAGPDRAVVLVTHRMAAVRRADRIYVLDGGRVAEEGTHDQLLAAGGRYAAMYAAQAAQYGPGPQSAGVLPPPPGRTGGAVRPCRIEQVSDDIIRLTGAHLAGRDAPGVARKGVERPSGAHRWPGRRPAGTASHTSEPHRSSP